jgi:His-Xaa-Ser system protein HxsD
MSLVTLQISEAVYSRTALLRTCYWFTDRCYIFVTKEASGFAVEIRAKAGQELDHDELVGAFQNALLDFQLRQDIEQQTGKIRELLVAKAVADAGTLDDPLPGAFSDPVAESVSPSVPLFAILGQK